VIGTSRARKISKERLDPTVERIVRGLLWWEYDGHRLGDDVAFNIELGRVRDRDPEGLAQRVLHGDAVGRSVAAFSNTGITLRKETPTDLTGSLRSTGPSGSRFA